MYIYMYVCIFILELDRVWRVLSRLN